MFVRFVANQKLGPDKRRMGLFAVADYLLEANELSESEAKEIKSVLDWFNQYLPVPPPHTIGSNAVFWFTSNSQCVKQMWQLARILDAHGYHVELVKASFVGKVVYQDALQVAAKPKDGRGI